MAVLASMSQLACPTHSAVTTSADEAALQLLLTKLPHTPSGVPNDANCTVAITPPPLEHDSLAVEPTATSRH